MAIMDGAEIREDLIRLKDWSLASIEDLVKMDPFDLIGELPDLSNFEGKVSEEAMNRFKMINLWESYFVRGEKLRTDIPKLVDLSDGPMSKHIRASIRMTKDLPANLRNLELRYLHGLWVRELTAARYCEPGQISFLHTSYYMEVRDSIYDKENPVKVVGSTIEPSQNDRSTLQCILETYDKGVNSYGDKIDLDRLMGYIKDRMDSLHLRPSRDRTAFIGNLNALYNSFGHLGMGGLKGPLDVKAPAYTQYFLQWAKDLGDLTGPFEEAEFYELAELKRIDVLLFWSQYLSTDWERYGLRNDIPTNMKRELFGYLETNQLLPSTNYGDILDRLIRLLTPM